MDRSSVANAIRVFLQEEFQSEGAVLTNTTDLLGEYFIDSFGVVSTALFLEKAFGIRLTRADINSDNFKNVDSLTALVCARVRGDR